MPNQLRAVLFDFDGLIVDTESTGYLTWREIFSEHGHELEVELYAQVVGTDFNTSYDPRRDLEQRTGRTFDWDAQFEAALRAVTLAAVNAAFVKHIDATRMHLVKAGDFTKN